LNSASRAWQSPQVSVAEEVVPTLKNSVALLMVLVHPACFRHTGEWQEIAQLGSLEECLSWIAGGNISLA
jgi:hypothetical protein